MGTSSNEVAEKTTNQIINYYLFHRKIFEIINKGVNPYFNNDIIDIYIMNPNWIDHWKSYSNYKKIKNELDTINERNEESLLNKLKTKCNNMIDEGKINNSSDNIPPSMDHIEIGKQFFELPIIKTEVFDYLIDYNTYKLFFNTYNPLNYFNIYKIRGIINDKLIILMLDSSNKVKFIYNGEMENEIKLIQLTANFTLQQKYNIFCENLINKTSNDIIQMLNKENIGNISQTKVLDSKSEFYYILRNESLVLKYINNKLKKNSSNIIKFSNVDKYFFIGLNNISSPAYLNAIIQNFINIDILTRYLLNENIFKIINNNSQIFQFTCFYLELLKIMCCEKEIKCYDLKDFNEIIYLINSKFKFNKDCTPGDLIKFILGQMLKEFCQLFKINNILNNNIISNYFVCLKSEKTECQNCKKAIINIKNEFLLEFNLDIINNEQTIQNSKEISLYDCFNNFTKPLFYKSDDDDIICKNCKNKTNSKFQNEIYFLPYILIIGINKETNNQYNFSFPEILDLNKYITNITPHIYRNNSKNIFELIGIISHNADNPKKYIAFCKNRILGDWYKYDDLKISYCQNQIKDILKENVDVLIYKSVLIQNNYKKNESTSFQTNNNTNSNLNNINNINITDTNLSTTLKVLIENNIFNNNIINNNNQNNKYFKEQFEAPNSMRTNMIEQNLNNVINNKIIDNNIKINKDKKYFNDSNIKLNNMNNQIQKDISNNINNYNNNY